MQRRIGWLVAVLALAGVLLAACGTPDTGSSNPGTTNPGGTNPGGTNPGGTNPGTSDPGAPDPGNTAPFLTGVITRIDGDRYLVEEFPDQQQGNKCWFAVSAETRILVQVDGESQPGTRADLQVGKRVAAIVTGPVLESYPCQGGADVLTVLPAGA
jgi:hypothetical protein